ncbi:MAG: DUF2971 domain-containing protein [Rhodospirillales bacterium]|nr:MAG: DUF2971 domain-containing protein [Rhodospirillales bacterium]
MVSDLWWPIQCHVNRISKGSMPAVHHYTSAKAALEILTNGTFRFSERAQLNDCEEITFGVNMACDTLRGSGNEGKADELKKCSDECLRNFYFFSASFSLHDTKAVEVGNDPCLWKRYGERGEGVVLSFEAKMFDTPYERIKKLVGDCNVVTLPMSYDAEILKGVLYKIIEIWNGTDIRELSDHVFMISSMFKHPVWAYENEYRYFVHQERTTISGKDIFKEENKNGATKRYLEIPIQGFGCDGRIPIHCVRLGSSLVGDDRTKLQRWLLENGYFENVDESLGVYIRPQTHPSTFSLSHTLISD